MKKNFIILISLTFIFVNAKIFSQVASRPFSQSSGVYSEITGTLIDSATSNSGATSLDDVQYLTRPIGFNLVFNGITYTTYSLTTNGLITFGATSPGTTNYTPISSTTAYAGCIAALARDIQGIYGFTATRTISSTTLTGVTAFTGIVVGKIIAGTGIASGTRVTAINTGAGTVDISIAATASGTSTLNCCSGELRSETQGTAGSQVHIIQWKNFQRFGTATLLDNFNFQIRIYETTNKVEVIYGSIVANSTAITPQVGLRGAANTDFNNRSTTTNWLATSGGLVNTATCSLSNTVFPASGLTFIWSSPPANDVGPTANLAPTGSIGLGSATIAPKATFRNFGTANQLTPFNVTYKITGAKNWISVKTDTISSGLSNNVTFDSTFVPDTAGLCNVTIYTSLANDSNRSNDTIKTSFNIVGHDVGTTAIITPYIGISGGSVTPSATIRNFSVFNETTPFNITCTISPGGYSSTISDTLSAGLSRNVTFTGSALLTSGTAYTVTVYTSLVGDVNRSNDTQRVVVTPIFENYGNLNGYFFANNLAINQSSYPEYCWKDTTGSFNILVNGVTSPGNTLVGTVDDGYFLLNLKNLLTLYGMDTTDKHIKYNGVCYDSIFPATNGMIGFTQKFGVTSLSAYQVDGNLAPNNAFLAFWHDFDLGTLTFQTQNRLSCKISRNQLIITYDKVAAFAPENNWASFQVVLDIVTGCSSANSNLRVSMADTTGGKTSSAFLTDYLTQYPAATGSITTFRNYICGYTFTGAPNVYTGFVSSANPLPASPSTQVNIKRPVFDLITGSGLAIEFGPNQNSLAEANCQISVLTLKIAIQGFQNNPIASLRRVRDTVSVYIREGVAPYPIFAQYKVLLDSAYNTVGNYAYGYANLDNAFMKEIPHYIEVRQRNTILVWSNLVTPVSDTTVYDFTTNVNKTYGNNSILINGVAAMYSGDVESAVQDFIQDGCITLTDVIEISNDASVFTSGSYVLTDLNYDGITDLTDVVIAYNNNTNFICKIQPPGATGPGDEIQAVSINVNNISTPAVILPDPNYTDKTRSLIIDNKKFEEEKK